MVVRWERVPNAILVVMVLAMSNIFCVAHSHLFTTIPAWRGEERGEEERGERRGEERGGEQRDREGRRGGGERYDVVAGVRNTPCSPEGFLW